MTGKESKNHDTISESHIDGAKKISELQFNLEGAQSIVEIITILNNTPPLKKKNGEYLNTGEVLDAIRMCLRALRDQGRTTIGGMVRYITSTASIRYIVQGHLLEMGRESRKDINALNEAIESIDAILEPSSKTLPDQIPEAEPIDIDLNDMSDIEQARNQGLDIDVTSIPTESSQEEHTRATMRRIHESLTAPNVSLTQFLATCKMGFDAGVTQLKLDEGTTDITSLFKAILAYIEHGVQTPDAPIPESLSRTIDAISDTNIRTKVAAFRREILSGPQSYKNILEQYAFYKELLVLTEMKDPTSQDLNKAIELYTKELEKFDNPGKMLDILPTLQEIADKLVAKGHNAELRTIERILAGDTPDYASSTDIEIIKPLLTIKELGVQHILKPFVHKVVMRYITMTTIPPRE